VCSNCGTMWELCKWYHEGQNLALVYGVCDSCEGFGLVGVECDWCGDISFLVAHGL
jgi:hypothetical protein